MEPISGFINSFSWLSNFHPCQIKYEGGIYSSLEAAYQAAKLEDLSARKPFEWMTASTSKSNGKRVNCRANWEEMKVGVMLDCLRIKFNHDALQKRLLATGDRELIHLNTHHDRFWGMVWYNQKESLHGNVLVGENMLGKLLMQVRNEIRSGGTLCIEENHKT